MQNWYYKRVTLRSALKASRIITVSENSKKEIVEFLKIDGSKISVVHHGVDSRFGAFPKASANYKTSLSTLKPGYLLYVGTIVPYKNIESLIEALSILKDRSCVLCQLVIAGSDYLGYGARLRSIAEAMGVSKQVTFLGYVKYEDLPSLYRGAKAFVLLSLCESFGMPILEAMVCGCPVVCSNVSSLPEIAGDAAVLVDPKNPLEVADAIMVLLEDGEYRHSMIARGKNRAKEFSWEKTASKTISLIEQAAADDGADESLDNDR